MLELYLIRHAESEDNKSSIISGRALQTKLTPRGIEQARALGTSLSRRGVRFNEVYSSTAMRALETASYACVAGNISNPIVQREELLELSPGDWEGKPKSILTPEVIAQIDRDPWNFRAPNGESKREAAERFYSWIEKELIPRHQEGLVAAVFSHAIALRCVLHPITGIPVNMSDKIVIDNTSLTVVRYDKRGWHLAKLNDTSHLD